MALYPNGDMNSKLFYGVIGMEIWWADNCQLIRYLYDMYVNAFAKYQCPHTIASIPRQLLEDQQVAPLT